MVFSLADDSINSLSLRLIAVISEKFKSNNSFTLFEYWACKKLAGKTQAHRPPFFNKERE